MSIEWSNRMLAITSLVPQGGINLNGMWRDDKGKLVEVVQVDDSVVSTVRQTDDVDWMNQVTFFGTVTDTNFKGQKLLKAIKRSCARLDGSVPSYGTVSSDGNSISMSFTNKIYHISDCIFSGEVTQDNATYTRLQISPTPQPTP